MIRLFVRASFFGRLVYHLSGHKYFTYPEEDPNYVVPDKYLDTKFKENDSGELPENFDIIVDFDGEDDPENPQNWPVWLKSIFIGEIMLLTLSVYMASAVYTPGIDDIMSDFGVGRVVATLPLSLFVIGYALGPLLFSPLSENAIFGRTNIYIVTLFIFFILQIPTALVQNIAGLCILRFIAGFFASPALATGGASVGDVISMPYFPVGIASWSVAAVCGPSLGPFFGSILVVKRGWRWTFWFMGMVSGISLIILSFVLPETYAKTLLLRKAKRLRKATGIESITSEGEIENRGLTVSKLLIESVWRPIEISLVEPIVLSINLYIALVYAVLYIWFEAFPIAYVEVYQFTLIEMGVSYVCIIVGAMVGCAFYIPLMHQLFAKKVLNGEKLDPEVFIPTAILGAVLMPIGIFIFGWSVTTETHWIGSMIGASIFMMGAFFIFQTLFNYLGSSFYRYLASVFAGNDLFRSAIAGCFPLFGAPLFNNLATLKYPVGWGSSVLGFISVGMILIPIVLWKFGPKMRASSKYAGAGPEQG